MKFRTAIAALLLISAFTAPAAAAPLYHLAREVQLAGPVRWDYLRLDAATHRLFISHGPVVTVLDARSLKVVGALNVGSGSHGIAIDPVSGTIYADSGDKAEVIAFNPRTFAPIATIPVVRDADGMQYDPASKRIYVVGGDGQGITGIDPAENKALPTVALGGTPEFFAPDGKGALYIAINDKNEIARFDTATNTITARWPTTGCAAPTGLAVDPVKRLVFTSCRSGVMDVLNADTGAVVAVLPIGKGTDAAAFDPARSRAFSSNGVGSLSVIGDSAAPVLLGTVPTQPGARTLAVDPASGDVYTVTAKVTGMKPPQGPAGRPYFTFAPDSLELLVYAPAG
ncbi:YncE family protein [Acidocella sp. KAb 2-4]|uniref:YncE family protein n=1 Tax=Acidocella sp. KAb 2-4 TaxID=2885158 RepID=UPI001D083E6C|nr:YncE family protein [Acidocella sp. KAb 2-4]MCB5943470.1 YncE family protein [Acidocella sp. KAb 2-4]